MQRTTAILVGLLLGSCAGSQSSSTTSACRTDTICLRTSGSAPVESGRLVVVWESLGERGPPEVAFDVPFHGNELTIAIPHAKVARPRAPFPVMPCEPELGAHCRRGVGIAVGYVLVLRDVNGNGRIEPDEVAKKHNSLIGAARVIVGFAEEAIEPTERAPAGMTAGIASYEPVRFHRFDRWKLARPGTVFELVVCTRGAVECDPPVPNVT